MRKRKIQERTQERIERIVGVYKEEVWEEINHEYMRKTRKPDILADKIADFGGSWGFIIFFACVLAAWVLWNTLSFTRALHFDEYPFILLNLMLSFTAAFQAPIIMMSQNRQAARDKEEFLVDHAINFKAENEVLDLRARMKHLDEATDEITQMHKSYQNQFEEMKLANEKSTQALLETITELKRTLERG